MTQERGREHNEEQPNTEEKELATKHREAYVNNKTPQH
jgi:hypothetical protein